MKKVCWWNDPLVPPIKSGKDTASLETANTAANQLESTMTGMVSQSDGSSTAVDPTKWMSCSTLEQPHHGANSVSRTVWEANPVELEWTSGRPRFITMGSTQIFMRTRRGVNVSGDFQIGPRRPACRDHSYQLDRWLTEATAWCFAGQVEQCSTK